MVVLQSNDDMTEDRSTKESILKMMVQISQSDGNLSDAEIFFLAQLAKNFGFSVDTLQSFLSQNDESFSIPSAELDRMTILYHLLFFIKSDGMVHPEEEKMIYHFGFKLGFNESLIRDMLAIIKNHIGKNLPPDDLLITIRKYLN